MKKIKFEDIKTQMLPVTSTTVELSAYYPDGHAEGPLNEHDFVVKFKKVERLYVYHNVPYEVVVQVMQADSFKKELLALVEKTYNFTKLVPDEDGYAVVESTHTQKGGV